MLSRRGVVAGVLALAATISSVAAAEQSAQDFLAGIYAKYKGKNTKGVTIDTHAALMRYFTPSLVKLIEDDAKAAKKRGDVPTLDGDPFIDAQDWEIKDFAITVKDTAPDKATGTVKFTNDGEKIVELDLIKLKQGWRIDEIRAPSGSLRDLFKRK